jgi:hypothetical protein
MAGETPPVLELSFSVTGQTQSCGLELAFSEQGAGALQGR